MEIETQFCRFEAGSEVWGSEVSGSEVWEEVMPSGCLVQLPVLQVVTSTECTDPENDVTGTSWCFCM